MNINKLNTEKINIDTWNIDSMSTLDMVSAINNEDQKVAIAIQNCLPTIAEAIDLITSKLSTNGRLIYLGAGTSGRLGVLDASECPPTYGVSKNLVVGVIAGGEYALRNAVENVEDSIEDAIIDLKNINLSANDVLVGIAASGRTPYVISGLNYAKELGCNTISITCCENSEMGKITDIAIDCPVGPEVVTGSTRMKAGTAQKMILNMLSTGTMIKLGKVYHNLMVDVQCTNEKLINRAKNIIMQTCECDLETASQSLKESNNNVKIAILNTIANIDTKQSEELLKKYNNNISLAIKSIKN